MEIHWSLEALNDLKEIYAYYKKSQNLKFAQKFRKQIFDRVGLLKNNPKLGIRLKTKVKNVDYRFLIQGHYKIVYSINPKADTIEIEAIIDSRSAGRFK